MHDLKTQLSDYLDHVVERVDVDEVFEERAGTPPVRPLRPRRPERPRQHWKGWPVAAVVVVAVVLAGVLVGVLRNDSSRPVVDTPPSTLAPPATTAPPTTVVDDTEAAPASTVAEATEPEVGAGPVLEWELVEGITWLEAASPELSYTHGEYVLLQHSFDGRSVLVSTSQDGRIWTEDAYAVPAGIIQHNLTWGWAVGSERIVALDFAGGGANSPESGVRLRAVIIDRASGEVQSHELPTGRQPNLSFPVTVAPDGSLLVATDAGRSWHSTDGEVWSEVTIDGAAAVLESLSVLDGALVTLRTEQVGDADETIMYRSTDGLEWAPTTCCDLALGPTSRIGLLTGWVFEPWSGGVLTTSRAPADATGVFGLLHLTDQGVEGLPSPLGELPGVAEGSPWSTVGILTGEVGIVVIDESFDVLFSIEGETWSRSTFPDRWGQVDPAVPHIGAAGREAVLVTVWSESDGFRLVRGTPTGP